MSEVSLDDKLRCLRRELALRKNVYRAQVARGSMNPQTAAHEIAVIEAIIADYERQRT